MTITQRAAKLVAWMLEISIDEAQAKYEQEIVQARYEFSMAIADAREEGRAAGYAEAIEKAALEADAEGKRRIMGPTTDGLAECRKIAKAIRALSPSTKKDMK